MLVLSKELEGGARPPLSALVLSERGIECSSLPRGDNISV